jgi:two-component system, OmpR family, phosphate regulon sensor histidine kinase PhoR
MMAILAKISALLARFRGVVQPAQNLDLPPPAALDSAPSVLDALPIFTSAPILAALPIPVLILDSREVLCHANPLARALFPGLREGVPISFSVRFPELLEAIDRVQAGKSRVSVDLVERLSAERSFEAHIALMMPQSAQASDPAIVISMLETTKMRQVEAMRVDFVANASHELRTPLASIIGFVETLQGPARQDAVMREKFLAIMAEQGRRMARLIDDLLSLSRIEMRVHLAPTEQVHLEVELGHLIETLSGLARERAVALVLRTEPGAETRIIGDRDEILRVFENLIENAIKYGASGGRVEIALRKDPAAGEVKVFVRDFGPGIAALHLPRLTERFYRADVEASRVLGGTGLGLAIVKHILNRHRGRLAILSKPGEGATFTVSLPLVPPAS